MKKIIKGNKGITLAALVITIIILGIISAITISSTIGEGGIFNKSQEEAEKFDAEIIRKSVNLAVLSAARAGNGTVTEENLTSALNNQFGQENYTLTAIGETGGFTITVDTLEFTTTSKGVVTENQE